MQVCEFQDTPLIDHLSLACIIGSSNGLLCVEIHPYVLTWNECAPPSLLLWNPAIREVRTVPIRTSIKHFEGKWISGFGFSTVVNDYNIERFFVSKSDYPIKQVEVYSLSTGSWKEIGFALEGIMHSCFETVSTGGVIFWHGSKAGLAKDYLVTTFSITDHEPNIGFAEEDDSILSFDITTKVFSWMPWPAFDHSRPKLASYLNKLTVYEHKLALLSNTKLGDFLIPSSLIDLWVMEEDTSALVERWSWSKKHTIVTSSGMYLCPFSIWRNDIVCEVPAESGVDDRLSSKILGKARWNRWRKICKE